MSLFRVATDPISQYPRAEMASGKGIFSKTNIIIFGGLFVLPMIYIGFTFVRTRYFGAEQGAACSTASDCKGAGAWCMKAPDGSSSFCTHACGTAKSCPEGWACGDSGYTRSWKTSSGTSMGKTPVNVCWQATGKGTPPALRE